MKAKIRLDTVKDVRSFVQAVSDVPGNVNLEDGAGLRVSAKSLMGALYTMEFDDVWCTCDTDISSKIRDYML